MPLVPASARALAWLWGIAALLLVLGGFFGFLAWRSRVGAVEFTERGLRVRNLLYGRTIAWDAIANEEAVVLNLSHHDAHQWAPKWRTNGLAVPGLQLGWFRLRNGSKALLFVTNFHGVVRVPTHDGYDLLLSAEQPEEMAARIRARAGG
jgi:hypothetical protein